MWVKKFGFVPMSAEDVKAVEARIVWFGGGDTDVVMLKKELRRWVSMLLMNLMDTRLLPDNTCLSTGGQEGQQ